MRLRASICFLAMALLCTPAYCGAIQPELPTGVATIDGVNYPINFAVDPESGMYEISMFVEVPGEYRAMATGAFDPDPSLSYGIAVTDFGAPSNFTFSFTMPIVPTPAPTEIESSIVGGLTDFTGNGVSITPSLADLDGDSIPELQIASANALNLGIDIGPAAAFGAGPAGALHNFADLEPEQNGPMVGIYTSLQLLTGFTMSGGGDVGAFTGYVRLDQNDGIIPEPSTLALGVIAAVMAIGGKVIRCKKVAVQE
jgi:hypothetical protein